MTSARRSSSKGVNKHLNPQDLRPIGGGHGPRVSLTLATGGEDAGDGLENLTPAQRAKWAEDNERIQRAAQAEAAELATKDRVTRQLRR